MEQYVDEHNQLSAGFFMYGKNKVYLILDEDYRLWIQKKSLLSMFNNENSLKYLDIYDEKSRKLKYIQHDMRTDDDLDNDYLSESSIYVLMCKLKSPNNRKINDWTKHLKRSITSYIRFQAVCSCVSDNIRRYNIKYQTSKK